VSWALDYVIFYLNFLRCVDLGLHVYDVLKTRKHEGDGADAASGIRIILLLTCIPGYQMLRLPHEYDTQMW